MDKVTCRCCTHYVGLLGCEYEENTDDQALYPATCPDFEACPADELLDPAWARYIPGPGAEEVR